MTQDFLEASLDIKERRSKFRETLNFWCVATCRYHVLPAALTLHARSGASGPSGAKFMRLAEDQAVRCKEGARDMKRLISKDFKYRSIRSKVTMFCLIKNLLVMLYRKGIAYFL